MKIEKEAEKILQEFSKTLENIPELEETHYIVDNINLTRKDIAYEKDSVRIMRNTKVDENGNMVVEKSKWTK